MRFAGGCWERKHTENPFRRSGDSVDGRNSTTDSALLSSPQRKAPPPVHAPCSRVFQFLRLSEKPQPL